jgi:hypothetical protein
MAADSLIRAGEIVPERNMLLAYWRYEIDTD